MAYASIASIAPQFENYPNYWLKAYEQGTTTPKVMATDSTAATTVSKFEINTDGFIRTAGAALVIPYIEGAYDLWLFSTAALADSNSTGSAIQLADNMTAASDASAVTFTQSGTGAVATNLATKLYEYISVADFGAVGDGVTDDTAAINAALAYVKDGGVLHFEAGKDYFVTNVLRPEWDGESIIDRYNDSQSGSPSSNFIGRIHLVGYGSKIIMTTATWIGGFPFCMMAFSDAQSVTVEGLTLEGDMNNKSTGWFDETNYMNQSPPAVNATAGLYLIRCTDSKIINCTFQHLSNSILVTDDRTFVIPFPDAMESYRSIVTGCRVYNCTQGMSMTYGATEEWLITNNHFEYTFIKIVQETDQGRAIHIKDNTFRDVSAILLGANNSSITGNTFNNLLAGISLRPQGGSLPTTNYDYDQIGTIISENHCYSDHLTPVQGGTAQPQGFLLIEASSVSTASQVVQFKGLKVLNNNVELWNVGGSSNGSFLNCSPSASLNISDMKIRGNSVVDNGTTGALICLKPYGVASTLTIEGIIDVSNNSFVKPNNALSWEFQFGAGIYSGNSALHFNNNYVDIPSTTNLISVVNLHTFKSHNNKMYVGINAAASGSIYWLASTPKIDIRFNNVIRLSGAAATGFFVLLDGETTTVYDTIMDEAIVQIVDNNFSNCQFVMSSLVAFPASAEGQYEIVNNTVRVAGSNAYSPSLSGFIAQNAVNPSTTTPAVVGSLPAHKVIWSASTTSATPIGWKWSGSAWVSLGDFA